MAMFTMQLGDVIESAFRGRPNFMASVMSDYPIFDASYRKLLNDKIIDHYLFREIGQETVHMFAFTLKRNLNEIMPLYNQLYESTLLKFDPLAQYDYHTIIDARTDGLSDDESTSTSQSNSLGTSRARTVESNMPSVQLANNGNYASSAQDANSSSVTDNSGTGSASSKSNSTNINKTATNISGRNLPGGELIKSFRSAMLNVDMMVINDLENCFMQVWTNGDSTRKGYSYAIPAYPTLY